MTTYTFKRITADRYADMLGMQPPAAQAQGTFLLGEAWTHIAGRPAYRAFFQLSDHCFVECEQPLTRGEWVRLSHHVVTRLLAAQEAAPARWWDREDATSFEGEVWRSTKRLISITFNPPAARHDNALCVVARGTKGDTTHSILKVY